ncbi:HepT-like ribonuclease domain-containing protein [Mucilaginibacter terrae]|uniref:HepT-like ribonuclease domain-containing protein n=1 Tax=Mucilaginibacter terrae TaxID=1955052 RepID=UPI0036417C12
MLLNRRLYLAHNGLTEIDFSANLMLQDAVTRKIEIIGEASGKILASFKLSHSQ